MTLDSSTLAILTVAIAFGLGVLSLAVSARQPGIRGARLWGAAMIASSAGYALLSLHASTGADEQLYAGWAGILVSLLLMRLALNRVCGNDASRNAFGLSILGVAVAAWLYLIIAQPGEFARTDTVWLPASVIAILAALDMKSHVHGSRFAAPAVALLLLLCAVAAIPIVDLMLRGPVAGSDVPPASGSPVIILTWVLGLALMTVCVLWLEFSQLYETMESTGMVDVLTGMSNRPAIIAEIRSEQSRSRRTKTLFSVAIVDIDNFTEITDTHGQRAGDLVLRWVAQAIRGNIRPYDRIGRYGSEEFLMMMPNTATKEALTVAERTRLAVHKQACVIDGKPISVTVSIGVAVGQHGADLESVLVAAGNAIAGAKERGRNCTVVAPAIAVSMQEVRAEDRGANA